MKSKVYASPPKFDLFKDIQWGGDLRMRFENWKNGDVLPSSIAWRHGIDDDYLLSRLRLHMHYRPKSFPNTEFFIQGQYPHLHFSRYIHELSYESHPHILQGFMKQYIHEWTVKLGRQTLDFGSRLALGSKRFQNTIFSYDLLRLDYEDENWNAAGFVGKQALESLQSPEGKHEPLGGYYLSWKSSPQTQIDQYTLYKRLNEKVHVYFLGTRLLRSWGQLELDTDLVLQAGQRHGFALHGFLSYALMPWHWSRTQVFLSTNIASGSKSPKKRYEPFSSAQHLERQSTGLAPYTNLKELGMGFIFRPLKKSALISQTFCVYSP